MTNTTKALRQRLVLVAVFAAVLPLASTGCNNESTVKTPPAGATSGTAQVLKSPSASPELKAQAIRQQQMGQAIRQQQMGQQQAQAMQQAHQQGTGQTPKH